MLIIRRLKLYYPASGIIKPIGGRQVHRLREGSSLNLCTERPSTGAMILSQPVHRTANYKCDDPLSTCAPDGHL